MPILGSTEAEARDKVSLLQSWLTPTNALMLVTSRIGYDAGGMVRRGSRDGFNVLPPYFPGALIDCVDLVVPELQTRRLFRREYEGRLCVTTSGCRACPRR